MSTSFEDIDVPEGAPGPSSYTVGEDYQGRLVIYDVGDAGWEARISIDIDDPSLYSEGTPS